MGQIKIIYTRDFIEYLDNLIQILCKKEYFGFIESADFYISKIYDFIEESIEKFPVKQAPHTITIFRVEIYILQIKPKNNMVYFF